MTLFNPSDNSIYSNLLTRLLLLEHSFGLRGSSVSSNIGSLVTDSVFGNSDDSMLYYESRVDRKHESNHLLVEIS